MVITKEDKILIKNLFELKGYNAKQLVTEFPSKGYNIDLPTSCCKSYWLLG